MALSDLYSPCENNISRDKDVICIAVTMGRTSIASLDISPLAYKEITVGLIFTMQKLLAEIEKGNVQTGNCYRCNNDLLQH